MGDKRNYAALDWVVGEIGDTLNDARQSLEAFVEDPRDTARIRFCLTHIHQVLGSLQMVEFHGASLFAEEMESLAEAIMQGQVTNEKEAQEALMRSLLQLPLYLEQVKSLHDDHPGAVLPLLNDLRAVRKQSYLSETNLFTPDLSTIEQIRGERHPVLDDSGKLKQIVQKLREMYQYAAASVLRGVKIDENLAFIEKVLTRMEGLTRGTRCHAMWQVAAALSEALMRDDVELSIAVRGLLRYIARELRILEEHCPAAFDAVARESLLRNLLYYVARAEDGGPRAAQVKRQYALDKALLGGSSTRKPVSKGLISPPEPDAIRSVVLALQDELNTCKHLLDSALSGQGSLSDIEQMMPYVKRIGDTLAVLGIGEMRKQMMTQHEALAAISAAGIYDDIQLIDIAGALANIENRLEAIAKGAGKIVDYANVDERAVEIDSAKEAVLAECRAGLDSVKDAIVESLSTQWDPSYLPNAVEILHHIQGGLNMVPLERSAKIIEVCRHYIHHHLVNCTSKPGGELQTLAEAIASIDYYLERLAAGHGDDLDAYLDMAEDCLGQLGYAFDRGPENRAGEVQPPSGAADEILSAAEERVSADMQAPEDHGTAQLESADEQGHFGAVSTDSSDTDDTDLPIATPDSVDKAAPAFEPAPTIVQPLAATDEDEDSVIDDEIIEIFIEEAAEVHETLAEYVPLWAANMADHEALMTVRRAFHTLKGSGRMVEALDVGELAWSIESMLNRVLDGSITPGPAHVKLIELAMGFVPSLISAFEHSQANPDPAKLARYMVWAEQLSSGVIPGELDGAAAITDYHPEAAEQESADLVDDDIEENEDQVLWDIFASEANTHLAVADEFLADMARAAPLYSPPTDSLQRALHTLKGSAHMAAVTPIASLITPLEGFVKELRSYQVKVDADILQLITDATRYTREGLDCIYNHQPVEIPKLQQFVARVQELLERQIAPLIHLQDQGEGGHKAVDPRLLAVMMAEEMSLLLDADTIIADWQTQPADTQFEQMAQLLGELDSLAAAALQANLPVMNELALRLGDVYRRFTQQPLPLNGAIIETLTRAHENLLDMVDQVAAGQDVQPAKAEIYSALQDCLTVFNEADEADEAKLVEEFADFPFEAADDSFYGAEFVTEEDTSDNDLATEGMSFAGEEVVHIDSEDLSDDDIMSFESEEVVEMAIDLLSTEADVVPDNAQDSSLANTASGNLTDDHFHEEDDIEFEIDEQDAVESEEDALVVLPVDDFEQDSEEAVGQFADDPTTGFSEADESDRVGSGRGEPLEPELSDQPQVRTVEPVSVVDLESPSSHPADVASLSIADMAFIAAEDYDPDILEIFIEEAGELVEELDEAIHSWESDWNNPGPLDTMKRALHTLKGGARLSGLMNLGEVTHEYESFLIQNDTPGSRPNYFQVVLAYQDRIHNGVKGVRALLEGESLSDEPIADAVSEPVVAVEPAAAPAAVPIDSPPETPVDGEEADSAVTDGQEETAEVTPLIRKGAAMPAVSEDGEFLAPQPRVAGSQAAQKRQGPQEMIKVSADLLEELVNLAGETSISRGRLQQQISDLSGAVDEVDGTLRRLNEQLRRLDLETEAQVLFRQEQMAAHEGFDPLEMDRYSQLQQLTRSLMESASDLVDLKITLTDKIKDTETLLLQQSRINSALQEGLMRSRMVPFSRLVPRLRRIVRQVASELGKHVNFELDNVEGEMDRSVLERMVAPLEHMLRNAVDHGIEMPDVRVAGGKSETGRILLSLAREGGDILLRLADDGRGIDLDRVREKAIERGLMVAGVDLSDHDVMQFILQAGFSTAESVTQISGRGVGMDVVAAEIKQLGGSIVIDSKAGVGSQFTVRLPFTVSVNRALMVQLGLETYAIPLNTIEGIVRVSPFELEHYYGHPDARFEYAGENYQVRHLGSILNSVPQPKLEGQVLPLPVILVRSAQNTMALQVDGLLGSREIVVKSLGPQFAAVQGISGATVMGDGSVVVILDPHALVRREIALASARLSNIPSPAALPEPEPSATPASVVKTIMVVDDSVTVRKVTTRFLEREGFNVITAKDGVDALQILQEDIPDLMLLDIEMPRMDGFEVAKTIRSTSRLKHLPIIMITSRTGDKHRQHALSIGVNDYLGKPYQEEQLLRTMESLLKKRKQPA